MTVEELNTKLYEKLLSEQEMFEQKLLDMEPREVLNHAKRLRCEKVVRTYLEVLI